MNRFSAFTDNELLEFDYAGYESWAGELEEEISQRNLRPELPPPAVVDGTILTVISKSVDMHFEISPFDNVITHNWGRR